MIRFFSQHHLFSSAKTMCFAFHSRNVSSARDIDGTPRIAPSFHPAHHDTYDLRRRVHTAPLWCGVLFQYLRHMARHVSVAHGGASVLRHVPCGTTWCHVLGAKLVERGPIYATQFNVCVILVTSLRITCAMMTRYQVGAYGAGATVCFIGTTSHAILRAVTAMTARHHVALGTIGSCTFPSHPAILATVHVSVCPVCHHDLVP